MPVYVIPGLPNPPDIITITLWDRRRWQHDHTAGVTVDPNGQVIDPGGTVSDPRGNIAITQIVLPTNGQRHRSGAGALDRTSTVPWKSPPRPVRKSDTDVSRYLACLSDALDKFANDLDAISTGSAAGHGERRPHQRDACRGVDSAPPGPERRLATATTDAERAAIRRDAINGGAVATASAWIRGNQRWPRRRPGTGLCPGGGRRPRHQGRGQRQYRAVARHRSLMRRLVLAAFVLLVAL